MWTGTESTISYNPSITGFFEIGIPLGRIGFIFDRRSNKIQKILLPGFKSLPDCDSPHKALFKHFLQSLFYGKDPVPAVPHEVLDWSGLTFFQSSILKYLKNHVRKGQVISYSELALKAGFPKAARACGSALAANPFPLVVPCHRVICQNGDIGGFQGERHNISLKKRLLEMENVFLCPAVWD